MTYGIYALENAEGFDDSLALVQQLNLQDEVKQTGDYDELHDKEEELVEEDKKESEEDTSEPIDESSDTSSEPEASSSDPEAANEEPSDESTTGQESVDDETPEDSDSKKEDEPQPAEETDKLSDLSDKKQTPVTESLRTEYYDRAVLEAIDYDTVKNAVGTVASGVGNVTMTAARLLKDLAVYLYVLGLPYYPGIIQGLKKTVLYLFNRSIKSLLKAMTSMNDFVKQHRSSLVKRSEEIKALKEDIVRLKEKAKEANAEIVLSDKGIADTKLISWMTVSGKTDPNLSVAVMAKFANDVTEQVDQSFIKDLEAVERLIALTKNSSLGNPLEMMRVSPFSGSFMKETNQEDSNLVSRFVYNTILPDQVLFVALLPKDGIKEISEIGKAYHESSVYLTADNRHPPTVELVDYMELEGVERFLDGLELICQNAIKHIDRYKQAVKLSERLKLSYKSYFQKLTADKDRQNVHDTLVEYIYLKQSFASRVYLPAAMDIRDYTSSYLMRALRLVKNNLNALQVNQKDSTV